MAHTPCLAQSSDWPACLTAALLAPLAHSVWSCSDCGAGEPAAPGGGGEGEGGEGDAEEEGEGGGADGGLPGEGGLPGAEEGGAEAGEAAGGQGEVRTCCSVLYNTLLYNTTSAVMYFTILQIFCALEKKYIFYIGQEAKPNG